jgi:uncharacterized protein
MIKKVLIIIELFLKFLNAVGKGLLILSVKIYQIFLRPWLGHRCRFHPTCSQYALLALQEHHVIRSLFLILKRLLKCHPFGPYGYDPVPLKKIKPLKKQKLASFF